MYSLKDAQDVGTEILAEVDRVCRKHGITYYMSEGTLLGAVRHKNTIPWDDDIDISMPRADYERFAQIASQELGEGFAFYPQDAYGENRFFDFIPHVAYVNSAVRCEDAMMRFYGGKLNHILLDIFILDNVPAREFSHRTQLMELKLIYALSWAHRYRIDYGSYGSLQRIAVFILSHIGKLFKQSTLDCRYRAVASRYQEDEAECYFLSNTLLDELDHTYKAAWFESSMSLEFGHYSFQAPSGYHAILTRLYGDYLQLPPEEKRFPEHYDVSDPCFKIDKK